MDAGDPLLVERRIVVIPDCLPPRAEPGPIMMEIA